MRLAELIARLLEPGAEIEVRAYDGSTAGVIGAPVRLEVRSPLALSYLASAPGELGLARAYITGALEVVGDLYVVLSAMRDLSSGEIPAEVRRGLTTRAIAARLWWPVKPPAEEARPTGRLHSLRRDAQVIAHHYDVSNRFYEWLLGESMAYTCAVFDAEDTALVDAQYAKFDLVARKLDLKPGMRLLDVGCGWGGMVRHAAKHYGVRALGVTLSANQALWAQKAIAEDGLGDVAEVRHLDYREVEEGDFDAVSSIGLTEHIGAANVAPYFRFLHSKLRPGGRLLNHCITRPDGTVGPKVGDFLGRYVFPDGELESPGELVTRMHDVGFEVRHLENLREHYSITLRHWCDNLDDNWAEALDEVGLRRARVWRLYLTGSRVGFDKNFVQLHQILGVKLDGTASGMPLRPDWT